MLPGPTRRTCLSVSRCAAALGSRMACYAPLRAWRGKDGQIVFQRQKALDDRLSMELPCGSCAGCRYERSRQWAVRICHEMKMHQGLGKPSSFLTLTYATEHLPPGGTLVKRDLQLFMKRLRKEAGNGIRFYACGEYGDDNKRPHYHVCLLNYAFSDQIVYGSNRRGDNYYESPRLSRLWPFGRCMSAALTFESAHYVARYCMKKVSPSVDPKHYEVMDLYGEVHQRLPEFALMSRGIGHQYYYMYGNEVRVHDTVIMNGREVKPPRFYDKEFEKVDEVGFLRVKRKRKKLALLLAPDNTPDRRRVKEIVHLKRLQLKKRSV